jgi:predicted TPR repeat methyltransferase
VKYQSCTDYWLDTKDYSFRGEFEAMYRDVEDPWHCNIETDSLNNRHFMEILFSDCNHYASILDIGCGLGGGTQQVYKRNGGGETQRWEVSATAVEKARNTYQDICFSCRDILDHTHRNKGKFELIILTEVIWYLLGGLDRLFQKVGHLLKNKGFLGVKQYFSLNQKYGTDLKNGINGFEDFIHMRTDMQFDTKVTSIVRG